MLTAPRLPFLSWLAGRVVVLASVLVLVMAAASGPARADVVRQQEMWVLDAVNAPAAWQVSQGSGVTVAVIDSGVNPGVSDLAGSVTTGPDYSGVQTPESDPHWGVHGTWMAALIAGHGHDGGGSGISGVAPLARILSIRVVADHGDPEFHRYERESGMRVQQDLARAIRYAVKHGAGVISMSLGYGAASSLVRSALAAALAAHVVVVASAGNSGDAASDRGVTDAPYEFPADYPGVLGVAAVAQDGAPASFSSANLSVQVAAPGVKVPTQGNDGAYWLVSGTSPACALVAGVAALIRSRYPSLPPALVTEAMTATAAHPPGGYNQRVGFGTVNAAAALSAARRLARDASQDSASQDSASQGGAGQGGEASVAGFFGGGRGAVPAEPVRPRGAEPLVTYGLLGLASLAALGVAVRRRRAGRGQARLP